MDIIIQNGVIQNVKEVERIKNIKNNEGLLKKNFKDYIPGTPGPYYDFADSHICIARKYHNIQNFCGPQIKNKIKLIETKDFNKNFRYCSICHCLLKPKPSFSSKKKILLEFDMYERKKDKIESIEKISKINLPVFKTINNKSKWITFANLLVKQTKNDIFNETHRGTVENSKKYIRKYYQFVYKLINSPIMYQISIKETKLLWPWELTPYQKFKLSNPNYINNPIYKINLANNIKTNYVMIE
jgi:hypothetical protein